MHRILQMLCWKMSERGARRFRWWRLWCGSCIKQRLEFIISDLIMFLTNLALISKVIRVIWYPTRPTSKELFKKIAKFWFFLDYDVTMTSQCQNIPSKPLPYYSAKWYELFDTLIDPFRWSLDNLYFLLLWRHCDVSSEKCYRVPKWHSTVLDSPHPILP